MCVPRSRYDAAQESAKAAQGVSGPEKSAHAKMGQWQVTKNHASGSTADQSSAGAGGESSVAGDWLPRSVLGVGRVLWLQMLLQISILTNPWVLMAMAIMWYVIVHKQSAVACDV